MVMVSAQASIAIIIISWGVGFLSFYLLSDLSKKKIYMEEIVSQLINFVIFMWIGKVLLNFSVFIKEPLTILAYPSNSYAFYLAVLFSVLTIGMKSKRKKVDLVPFLNSFIHVFLLSSFVYEFIQIVWSNNTYSIRYMGLLAVLIVAIVVIRERITIYKVNILMLIGWTLGTIGLAFIMPFIMVFGYTISPLFLGLILVYSLAVIILQRKKVS
ncbi:hypothetical protein ACFSFY_16275 [Sporosarcina siberiensis]|uniref:EamA-like transporter family protein n=1 Tax=Sporosarcina siberiensis TaxID=1365606 RepID=A0ABW4SJ87_9BACL